MKFKTSCDELKNLYGETEDEKMKTYLRENIQGIQEELIQKTYPSNVDINRESNSFGDGGNRFKKS